MFNILGKWFEHFRTKKKKVPPNFDVHLVINVIVKMLESQLVFGILHAINFWYSFGDAFQSETNVNFIKIINKFYFFKLFLHWSKKIREVFGLFLTYKIAYIFETSDNADIERVMWRINAQIRLVKKACEAYEMNRLRWESRSKIERIQQNTNKLKNELILSINILNVPNSNTNGENFFTGSKKFEITANKKFDMRRNSMAYHPESNVFNFTESERTIKKLHNYQNILKNKSESALEVDQLPYCKYSIEEFGKVQERFYDDFSKPPNMFAELIPKLNLNVLMDEFELKDTDENDW